MEKPLVSIIVPVFNGEKTIERCLASIKYQTYRNLEILVIDDGSTDHTDRILTKYEKSDSRFRIIRKDNSGVSDSRNRAIGAATGTFIQFVDADDWLVRGAVEHYVSIMAENDCDMIISHFYRVVGRNIYLKGHIKKEGMLSRKEFAAHMMEAPANFYYGVLWNKFFRADIIKNNAICCSLELNWCEDFLFNLEYLKFAERIYVDRRAKYYYVKTKGSLVDTQVNLKQTVHTRKILFEDYRALYESIDMYKKNKIKISMFYFSFAKDKGKKVRTA